MARNIYTTEGIILKKFNVGEADQVFSIFTKDFGKLIAKAQGVRHLKSKLRYSLSGFSFCKFSFVGTFGNNWRLIDVEEKNIFGNIRKDALKIKYISSVFLFLDRLIQGEQVDINLWDRLSKFLLFLENKDLGEKELSSAEILIKLRILYFLGYLDNSIKWENVSLDFVDKRKSFLGSVIDRSVARSHL